MKLITEKQNLKLSVKTHKYKQKIALVPTMGNLHEGHLELVRLAREVADIVMVSIFVNPMQFALNEDFSTYPRTLSADIDKLSKLNVDYVFAPAPEAMYNGLEYHTQVSVPEISHKYCGYFRPSFFSGVATVVTKLFNLVQPDIAIFGEKDFQQLYIIKKMVHDLDFPIEIISVPTLREKDGLALSSRNQYLNQEERLNACLIYQTLTEIKQKLFNNTYQHETIIQEATHSLEQRNFKVEYINICHKDTLATATSFDKELVVLIAAWIGPTRLIDNLLITLE